MVFRDLNIRNPLYQFRDEMDRLFNGFFGPAAEGLIPSVLRGQPPVNVWERDDAVLVEMEVPGVKKDQLDLSVVGSELSIQINRPDIEQEGVTYHRRERPVGSISRVLPLPHEVDANRIEAELHDGILIVTLPKAESAKPRKITIA